MAEIIMGVDFGDVRTGLALSDATGLLAYGAGCVKCEGLAKIAAAVAEAAGTAKVARIVVGYPKNMDGSEGYRCDRCRRFAEELEALLDGVPVELYDERLTTVSAHRILSESNVRGKKRKAAVDELSATLILQAYLDSHR